MQLVTSALACYEASQFARFHGTRDEEGVRRYLILGRFDQLALAVGPERDERACRLLPARNARASSGCTYIGRLLGGGDFDPSAAAETHPLVGHCSLRLARRVLKEAGSFDFLLRYLERSLPLSGNLRWAVVSGTGWEDLTVLLFGRSFNAIKRGVGKLRAVCVEDVREDLPKGFEVRDGLHHLVLTSCTLPGIALPPWTTDWAAADTQSFLARIEAEEPLRWAVRVETYPGHWDACVSLLRERAGASGFGVEVSPLFGQGDIRIAPAGERETTHGGLVRFLAEVMFPIEAMEQTVVRTVETRLIPEIENYHEDALAAPATTRTLPRRVSSLERFDRESRHALEALGVPPHTLGALRETLSHIEDMAGDRLHGEEFGSMLRLAETFIDRTARERAVVGDLLAYQCQAREMQLDISDWQMNVERCLADRFRGPYPAGDTLMLRLGNHSGAHQRFLVVMDHFAQESFDLACECFSRRLPGRPVHRAALATFIGNSPSAYAASHLIRRLGCGFTDVPAHMVARLQDLPLTAHETGHHFFRAFLSSFPEAHKAIADFEEDLQRDLREFFAECFASQLCFPGAPASHETAAYETVRGYFAGVDPDNHFVRSALVETTLRMKAVHAWVEDPSDPEAAFDRLADDFRFRMASLFDQPAGSRIELRIAENRAALSEMRRLVGEREEFRALMDALGSCANAKHFSIDEGDGGLLSACREMMQSPPSSGAESLAWLDRLWFIALRSDRTQVS